VSLHSREARPTCGGGPVAESPLYSTTQLFTRPSTRPPTRLSTRLSTQFSTRPSTRLSTRLSIQRGVNNPKNPKTRLRLFPHCALFPYIVHCGGISGLAHIVAYTYILIIRKSTCSSLPPAPACSSSLSLLTAPSDAARRHVLHCPTTHHDRRISSCPRPTPPTPPNPQITSGGWRLRASLPHRTERRDSSATCVATRVRPPPSGRRGRQDSAWPDYPCTCPAPRPAKRPADAASVLWCTRVTHRVYPRPTTELAQAQTTATCIKSPLPVTEDPIRQSGAPPSSSSLDLIVGSAARAGARLHCLCTLWARH